MTGIEPAYSACEPFSGRERCSIPTWSRTWQLTAILRDSRLGFQQSTRRAAQGDERRPARVMMLNKHADHHALSPRGAYESLNLAFARLKRMRVAVFGQQDEPREIAESIVEDRHDLAGEFAMILVRVHRARRRNAGGVRQDPDGIAA